MVCCSSEYLTQGCDGLSLSHRWSLIRPHPVRRGKGSAVASLSLSLLPLVIDPAVSLCQGKGGSASFLRSTTPRQHVRSAVHAVLSDQAPARQGLRQLLADSARRRSPSYIPMTSRYHLRPCSTARLPTSLHVDLP